MQLNRSALPQVADLTCQVFRDSELLAALSPERDGHELPDPVLNHPVDVDNIRVKHLYVDAKRDVQLTVDDLQERVVEHVDLHQMTLTETVNYGPRASDHQRDVMIPQVVAVEVHEVNVLVDIYDKGRVDDQALVPKVRKRRRLLGLVVEASIEEEAKDVSVDG